MQCCTALMCSEDGERILFTLLLQPFSDKMETLNWNFAEYGKEKMMAPCGIVVSIHLSV